METDRERKTRTLNFFFLCVFNVRLKKEAAKSRLYWMFSTLESGREELTKWSVKLWADQGPQGVCWGGVVI